jgi:hypothetical protein
MCAKCVHLLLQDSCQSACLKMLQARVHRANLILALSQRWRVRRAPHDHYDTFFFTVFFLVAARLRGRSVKTTCTSIHVTKMLRKLSRWDVGGGGHSPPNRKKSSGWEIGGFMQRASCNVHQKLPSCAPMSQCNRFVGKKAEGQGEGRKKSHKRVSQLHARTTRTWAAPRDRNTQCQRTCPLPRT